MRNPRPVLLQLWTVRNELKTDFEGTIAELSRMGFDGVEPFNYPAVPAAGQAAVFRNNGLSVQAAHLPLPAGETLDQSLEAAAEFNVDWIVSGFGPDDFGSDAAISRTAERANEAAGNAAAAGYGFALHNHWWEFEGEPPVWERFLPLLDPAVKIELDTYWARVAGRDPVSLLGQLGSRAPLVHMKDGPALQAEPMLALGDGKLDVPAIARAAAADVLIIELDEFEGNMMDAVSRSLQYLREIEGHG